MILLYLLSMFFVPCENNTSKSDWAIPYAMQYTSASLTGSSSVQCYTLPVELGEDTNCIVNVNGKTITLYCEMYSDGGYCEPVK